MKIKQWVRQNKVTVAGAVLGLILGYLYYHFIGCSSGSCAITSRPLNSSLYGAVMGGLFFSLFQRKES
jgi:hypothetical protein